MTDFEIAFATGMFIVAFVNLVVLLIDKMLKKTRLSQQL